MDMVATGDTCLEKGRYIRCQRLDKQDVFIISYLWNFSALANFDYRRPPGHGRYPRPGQMIYSSVFRTDIAERRYKPKASTIYLNPHLSSQIWQDKRPQEIRLRDLPRDVVEYDLYDSVIEVIRNVANAHESPSLSTLHEKLRKMILESKSVSFLVKHLELDAV